MSIESDKLLSARLSDAIKMTDIKNIPSFLGFLNEREFSYCKSYLSKEHIKHSFFGGYDNAEKVFIAILPDWADEEVDYPFCTLKFTYKKEYRLSHRDFLGSLMALGIERDKVGDILVCEGVCYAFVAESVKKYCLENITKVGSVGVDVCITNEKVIALREFEEVSKTIASSRADCVVGAICNLSREKAKEFILSGNLIVNHIVCESVTKEIKSGDSLSVRKHGKFIVISIDEKTKKGRLKLSLKKYL